MRGVLWSCATVLAGAAAGALAITVYRAYVIRIGPALPALVLSEVASDDFEEKEDLQLRYTWEAYGHALDNKLPKNIKLVRSCLFFPERYQSCSAVLQCSTAAEGLVGVQEVWQSFATRCVILLERCFYKYATVCIFSRLLAALRRRFKLACRNCVALRDFTGESSTAAALDLGCGTGGTAFELATVFGQVLPALPSVFCMCTTCCTTCSGCAAMCC